MIQNALEQLQQYADRPFIEHINAYPDIHYCQEKALPVGVAFTTSDYCYPLVTGKDIGCGVMYLRINKTDWIKPFDKVAHYQALLFAHQRMTDEGLGGGNHFLSVEEDNMHVYIICHTGTRNRGITLYQECVALTRDYAKTTRFSADCIPVMELPAGFIPYYNAVLEYGYARRKTFCIKTMIFLQQAGYIRCRKQQIPEGYLLQNYLGMPDEGYLHDTAYLLEDSVHNHLRFENERVIHRKGSTEILPGKIVVIPLSMSRGSLLVKSVQQPALEQALWSCSHGAGRKLSRFNAMKYWRTTLKEKERKAFREQFSELLSRNGEFPSGYVQEFDFAYKDSSDLLAHQPYLKLVTQTRPVVTIKYTEI